MNTLNHLDAYLSSYLTATATPARPSTPPPKLSTPAHTDGLLPPPSIKRLSSLPPTPHRRKLKRRPKPTSSSIKLPPPSTPLLIRITLTLWSILLIFWRSLVGETRAERFRKGGRRRERKVLHDHSTGLLSSSDEGSASEGEAEGDGEDHPENDPGWVDPVTRAPEEEAGKVDQPDEDEFIAPREPEGISFRLRSAEKNKDRSNITTPPPSPTKSRFQPHPSPPSILSNPIIKPKPQPISLPNITDDNDNPLIQPKPTTTTTPSPIKRQNARLLPNPMSTSLLDPSVPSIQTSPSTSISISPNTHPRSSSTSSYKLHQTPFHLQKTLILDLDETLIHSTSRPMGYAASAGGGLLGLSFGGLVGGGKRRGREGHTVEVVLNGRSTTYHVYKRPYVDHFLKKVASWYTLVIFTASMPEYADPVIDWLDGGRGLFARKLYRDSCHLQSNGAYIKDLALVEADLSRVCFMDNSPISYSWNKANALPIEGWTSDPNDEALLQSIPVLDSLRFVNDVRRILGIRGFT